MSEWYPAYEETKTMDLRWLVPDFGKQMLQQKFVIRSGIGAQAKFTEEWRYVPFAKEPAEQS